MTSHQLTFVDYALWSLQVLTEGVLLWLISYLKTAPKLTAWRLYLAFDLYTCAVEFSVVVAGKYLSLDYSKVWVGLQIVNFLILGFFCVQLVALIVPQLKRLVIVFSIAAGASLVLVVTDYWPIGKVSEALDVTFNATRLCAFILLIAILLAKTWEWPYIGITAGIAAKLVAVFGSSYLYRWSFDHDRMYFVEIRYLYGVLMLAVLLIWLVTTWARGNPRAGISGAQTPYL